MKAGTSFIAVGRRAALNAFRLKSQSVLIASICIILSFMALFSLLLFQCAALLESMSNLPYLDHYLFCEFPLEGDLQSMNKQVSVYGDSVITHLGKFEIVEDVFGSQRYMKKAELHYITKKMGVSEKEGEFLWTVLPNSAYDDSFRHGERILTKGRHLTKEDYCAEARYIMMDELLAEANDLTIGSKVRVSDEETFTVVGLFQTVKQEAVPRKYENIPYNLLLASTPPTDAEMQNNATYDVYLKFRDGVTEADIAAFFDHIAGLGFVGENLYYRYEFVSVAELNRVNNAGIRNAYNIAAISIATVFVVAVCAVYAFVDVMVRARTRELLLYKALGERKRRIILCCTLECLYIMIPSVACGVLSCALFCLDWIKALFIGFATQMTPENLRSTSSIWVETQQNVGELISEYVSAGNIVTISLSVCGVILLLAVTAIMGRVFAVLRQKTISLLGERRG